MILKSDKSWTPDPLRDLDGNRPYLKIELVSATSDRSAGFQVHGIATQGDEEFKTWVTKYSIDYTAKARPSDDDWKMIQDFDGNDAIFEGNSNAEVIHTNVFLRSGFKLKDRPVILTYSNPNFSSES